MSNYFHGTIAFDLLRKIQADLQLDQLDLGLQLLQVLFLEKFRSFIPAWCLATSNVL